MGKIVMDALELGSFVREVVFNLPFLKRYADNKHSYDRAVYYANNINLGPIERALDVVTVIQNEIIGEFGKTIPNVSPTMYYSDIIWEYVYILLYYSHYREELWVNTILPKMWTMQRNAIIRDEMKKGEEYVNQYIKAREALKEKINAQTPTPEEIPDIVQTMRDINSGKIRYNQVDWVAQIKEVLKLCNLMTTKFPYVIWLWSFLCEIDDLTTRMDILGRMQDVASKCFENPFDAKDFSEDCRSLYRICSRARGYYTNDAIKVKFKWTDERKNLTELAHILCDECVDPEYLVAITEEIYQAVRDNKQFQILPVVLKGYRYTNIMSITNILDFVKNLYVTEGFRELILVGKSDSLAAPSIVSFNWEIRNKCFDVYIKLRKEQIKAELNKDNRRVRGADDVECLEYLLAQEQAVVNRENSFEQFQGSAAYHAMWYPGRQAVLDLLNVFIEHLKMAIEEEKNKTKQAIPAIISDEAIKKVIEGVTRAIKEDSEMSKEEPVERELKEEKKPTTEEIEEIFLPAYTKTSNCQMLINLLLDDRDKISENDWARYALTIYNCKKIFRHRPDSFKDWLPIFCKLLGKDVAYRAPSDLNRTKCKTDISLFLPQ